MGWNHTVRIADYLEPAIRARPKSNPLGKVEFVVLLGEVEHAEDAAITV
jgi:hypothetical protein